MSCCYFHKYNGPDLRYKIESSYPCGCIVWIIRPFVCKQWPNLNILKHKMNTIFLLEEKVAVKCCYLHNNCITPSNISRLERQTQCLFRERHESCNGQLKSFNALSYKFFHGIDRHDAVFWAFSKPAALSITTY